MFTLTVAILRILTRRLPCSGSIGFAPRGLANMDNKILLNSAQKPDYVAATIRPFFSVMELPDVDELHIEMNSSAVLTCRKIQREIYPFWGVTTFDF